MARAGQAKTKIVNGQRVDINTNQPFSQNITDRTVTADKLMKPVSKVTVPEPAVATIPDGTSRLVNNISRDNQGFISAQTEEAKQLRELQQDFGQLGEQQSLTDLYSTTLSDYGVTPDSFKELKDIQLRLTDMDTRSELTQTRIAGAAGQTFNQGQMEVTQEQRENAVRSAGLAARAAVLQGNIETAQDAAKQLTDLTYQDRTLESNNLLQQIDFLQTQVDDQTAQLLEDEKRQYEEDLAKVTELKEATQAAVVAGASQAEIRQLTDPTTSDEDKLSLAQSIQAREARIDINLSRGAQNALINERNLNSLIARAEIGDQEAIDALGIATDSIDNTGLYGEMEASAGGKETTDSFNNSLEKAMTVAGQLNSLATTFQSDEQLRGLVDSETGEQIGVDLSPITSIFRSKNPYDVKAQQIQASINGIVPNLARGIYGEVGVLTDQDVARYAQTIPNLASTKEVRDAMLGLTLKTVLNSVRQKMAVQARAGRDVSGQTRTLEELERTVGEAMLPVNKQTPEYSALIESGAPQSEVDRLLKNGYELEDVISYYSGQ